MSDNLMNEMFNNLKSNNNNNNNKLMHKKRGKDNILIFLNKYSVLSVCFNDFLSCI